MRTAARPAPPSVVRVGTFGGVSALPLLVAQRLGLDTAHGLSLATARTSDSGTLRDDLLAGRIDVAHAAPDNAIAWADALDGDAHRGPASVAVWLAGSNGPITLVAREAPDIASLRGGRIAVDAPTSGFAPILVRLLASAGLASADVELVALGATRMRHAALLEGRVDASMLTLPWSALAVGAGLRRLGDHATIAAGMLTSAAIVRRDWLATHAELADRYRRTVDAALGWLRDPASHDTAAAWLAEDLGLEADTAGEVLEVMADRIVGWPPSVVPAVRAIEETATLRVAAGLRPLRPASDYLVLP
ncbi:MAG: ABC transporter substrate-binding protein [Chloroflexota bacterium]